MYYSVKYAIKFEILNQETIHTADQNYVDYVDHIKYYYMCKKLESLNFEKKTYLFE